MLIGQYDGSTGEQILREATQEEIAEREAEIEAFAAEKIAQDQALAQKAADKAALLERLGMTSEEAELLLS
jgi:hypothetical protein